MDGTVYIADTAFSYDATGRLTAVTDRYGNATSIARDQAGRPTAIVGPFGHTTGLGLHPDGYLATVTDPVGDTVTLDYREGGLLERLTDAKGYTHLYDYDDLGRLIADTMPVGSTTLTRSTAASQYTVEMRSATGLVSRHEVARLAGNAAAACADARDGECQRRQTTLAHGGMTQSQKGSQGHDTVFTADGSRIDTNESREPALGLVYPGRVAGMAKAIFTMEPYLSTAPTLLPGLRRRDPGRPPRRGPGRGGGAGPPMCSAL
jgi:YD repeat-containing protein